MIRSTVVINSQKVFQKVITTIFHDNNNNNGSVASSLLFALGVVEDFDDVITLSTHDIDTLYYYVKDEKEIIKRNKYGK
mgnify:CR=1 FL=1